MASSYLWRNIGSNGNRKTMTFSAWVKRSGLDTASIFTTGSGAERDMLLFESSGIIQFSRYNGSYLYKLQTNAKYRDTNGWYHIVAVLDTPQATEANRMKLYVNGEQVTSFSAASYPSQDYQSNYNQSGYTQYVGQDSDGNFDFDGCMSHVHYVDGLALTPATFGSTDSTTGEWKINTSPTVSDYGTNGFFVLKDNNSGTDQSGEGNNLTTQGTITETKDNPSNVFCTMNPLDKSSSMNLSNGNTRTASPSNNWMPCKATIGMLGQNGKFYWEGKCESGTYHYFGVYDASGTVRGSEQSEMDANRFVYVYNGGMERTITGQSAIASGTYATFANTDIIGVALDKENGTITFYKNGTEIYTETHSSLQTKNLIPGTQAYGSDIQWNFGNGYFGTTAVASAGTNASGNGIFEYDVPSGYTALSTKGLNL